MLIVCKTNTVAICNDLSSSSFPIYLIDIIEFPEMLYSKSGSGNKVSARTSHPSMFLRAGRSMVRSNHMKVESGRTSTITYSFNGIAGNECHICHQSCPGVFSTLLDLQQGGKIHGGLRAGLLVRFSRPRPTRSQYRKKLGL